MSSSRPVLAIDVGGTKLAAGVVDAEGTILVRHEIPTDPTAEGCGEQLWHTLLGLLDEVWSGAEPDAVGVGCGGPMRWPSGEVSPLNLPAWRDFPLRARLQARFPKATVRLANDAIAMAVGEHWRGAGRDARALLGVVVSTGVGGGLVIDGRVDFGATGNAGHVGHVVVDPDGPPCACGGRGCLEAVARGPALVGWALEQGWAPSGGAAADGRSLLASAHAGDQTAGTAFARAGNALGVAVASAAHLLELDVVAVGGGLSQAGDLLLDPARAAFSRHSLMDFAARCRLVPAALGPDAGLVGAAALVSPGTAYWTAEAD